jgi:hypothetical protein
LRSSRSTWRVSSLGWILSAFGASRPKVSFPDNKASAGYRLWNSAIAFMIGPVGVSVMSGTYFGPPQPVPKRANMTRPGRILRAMGLVLSDISPITCRLSCYEMVQHVRPPTWPNQPCEPISWKTHHPLRCLNLIDRHGVRADRVSVAGLKTLHGTCRRAIGY